MNLPNLLTLFRMVLVPIFVVLVLYHEYSFSLAVFVAAGVTDALDGLIARHFGCMTDLGALLDPIADKFLLMSAFLSLTYHRGPVAVPLWLTVLTVGRDVILLLASAAVALHGPKRIFRPSIPGKATTVIQIALVTCVLLDNSRGLRGPFYRPLVALTTVATVVSGIHYLVRFLRQAEADAKAQT